MARPPASSSHGVDPPSPATIETTSIGETGAMIRLPRMTIATLKQSVDRRFTRLDRGLQRRFAAIDQKFESVDRRFDDLEARLTARIDMRFESLSAKIDAVLTQTTAMRDQFVRAADEHEYRIRDLETRLPR